MAWKDTTRKGYHRVSRNNNKNPEKNWWMYSYCDFGGDIGKVYDWQVADYCKKHMRFIDRLNFRKIATAMQYSFSILSGSLCEPDVKNGKWTFFKDF